MTLALITPPTIEPISLADLKAQVRVSGSAEDALLSIAIAAARRQCESITGRALITQTWQVLLDAWPTATTIGGFGLSGGVGAGAVELARPPVLSVTSVQYVPAGGSALVTLDPAAYVLDATTYPGWLMPVTSWPDTAELANCVRVTFTAGYGPAADDVPEDLRSWMLLTAGYLYAQREAVDMTGKATALPGRFFDSLLDGYRAWTF